MVFLPIISDGDMINWEPGRKKYVRMVSGEKKLFSLVESGFWKEVMEGPYIYLCVCVCVCIDINHDLISANVTKLCARDKCRLGCPDLSVFGILGKERQT